MLGYRKGAPTPRSLRKGTLSTNLDYDTEIVQIVSRYYEVADNIASATASGCRMLQINPFATINRREVDLRTRLAGA